MLGVGFVRWVWVLDGVRREGKGKRRMEEGRKARAKRRKGSRDWG